MTRKQLQALISAGVFSTALLSGVAYADDSNAGANTSAPTATTPTDGQGSSDQKGTDSSGQAASASDSSKTQDQKQTTSTGKGAAQHGCAGADGCSSGK